MPYDENVYGRVIHKAQEHETAEVENREPDSESATPDAAAPEINDESTIIVESEQPTDLEPEGGQPPANSPPRVSLEKIPKDSNEDPLAVPDFTFRIKKYVYQVYDYRSRGRRWVRCVGKVVEDDG